MHLKTLTIKGFKSFADTTTLELEPGVTVVVGPNGSGKSNIVDAVAWVLGAQGTKTVRAGKMEDVIFAGTAKRAALGRAEVHLTIDNSDGIIPIDLAEVSISRTLFRNGDSEYAINNVPCRLLDVQELLSDSGVGRQQHVIVGQGMLDSVLNARPEDRRTIIEEAAGVLKYRKRKEKAERRLESTEGNLLRLSDLLREVRRQLRPLERQADAARRHGALVEELTAIRLHVAGRELAQLKQRLESGAQARAQLATDERSTKDELARLDAAVLQTEAELTALGADDLGDSLVRTERLRERAKGLAAVLAERRRGLERDRAVAVDQAVISTLEAEASRLQRELEEASTEGERLLPEAERLQESEASLAAERADFEARWGAGELPTPTGAAAEVRGELAALRSGMERVELESSRLQSRLGSLTEKSQRLAGEARAQRELLAEAEGDDPRLAGALAEAEEAHRSAEAEVAQAEVHLRAVDADRAAWTARADALASALDDARARAGAERVANVEGVLGTLLDLVEVDEGWEPAFEAAVGPALAAVVVDGGADAAKRALDALGEGAVLALGVPGPSPVSLPSIGEAVRAHVRASRSEVARALDSLLAGAVCVDGDWTSALDASLANPDATIVTRNGDRFGTTGWRVGAAGAGATGAALDEARAKADALAQDVLDADARLTAARADLAAARARETDLTRELATNRSKLGKATETIARIDDEIADATAEAEAVRNHLAELAERAAQERARTDELQMALPGLEQEEQAAAEQARAMQAARSRLEEKAAAVGALRTDLEIRATGIEERRQYLQHRLTEVEERLSRNVAERDEAANKREVIDAKLVATDRLAELLTRRLEQIETWLADLRERRQRQSEAQRAIAERLDGLRRQRNESEKQLEGLRERAQRAELEAQELTLRLEAATETLRRDLDTEPDVAMATECPPLPENVSAPARLRELERELRLMGPINPLALEEFNALQERHTFLEAQLEDVKSSRRELSKIIKEIDAEIVNVFVGAFADVSQNFTNLFETLFPGGAGSLKLTDPNDPLNTGIEVEARPSGKNVRKLSLLSGGERSLTAMAFLFAVFRSRPSPFYLLDEVEAALDDVNLHRFLDLLHEFRREAQLIVVSHQKRTMETADMLYGVTMQPGGSSRVVSEKVAAGA